MFGEDGDVAGSGAAAAADDADAGGADSCDTLCEGIGRYCVNGFIVNELGPACIRLGKNKDVDCGGRNNGDEAVR